MVPAVDRAARILQLLARDGREGLGVSEISRRLGLNKSTTHGILTTLARHEIVAQDPQTRRFRPGRGLQRLAPAGPVLTVRARPILERLLEASGETVFLAVWQEEHIVLIDKAESGREMSITSPLGRRLPHSAGALGKIFHAWMAPGELRRLLQEHPLRPFTARSISDPAAYAAELKRVRRRGAAYDDQEYLDGVRAVAVPLLDPGGRPEAAVCVVGPSARLSPRRLRELAAVARDLAREAAA